MSIPNQNSFGMQRLNLVSQLVNQPASPGLPLLPAGNTPGRSQPGSPLALNDRFALAAPARLFQGLVPNASILSPVMNASLSGQSPQQQLMSLGAKYGVPFKGADLNRYQSEVIKAIVRVKARELGIPEHVALGIVGNESGWKMWKDVAAGTLIEGRNVRDGVLKSTDWGAMQINDKAHAKAFPRAKQDLEYNIDYGLRFLARQRQSIQGDLGLGLGDWDRTVASYNLGHDPSTQKSYQIASRYVGHVADRADQFA